MLEERNLRRLNVNKATIFNFVGALLVLVSCVTSKDGFIITSGPIQHTWWAFFWGISDFPCVRRRRTRPVKRKRLNKQRKNA